MSANLEEFKANLRFGLAKPSRYNVIIASPDKGVSPEIGIFAERVDLPGKGFATRTMGLPGPGIKFPYQEIYTDIRATFICSSDTWERRWFEGWHRNIVNPKSGYFGYYKNFVRDLIIQQLNEHDNVVYEGKAIDAWPCLIDNQELDYKRTNEYQTLTVIFCYHKFIETSIISSSNGGSGVSGNLTPSRNNPNSGTSGTLPVPGAPVAQ